MKLKIFKSSTNVIFFLKNLVNDLIENIHLKYPLKNFHYIELFIFFNDFINENFIDKEKFIVANLNLIIPYKDKVNKNNNKFEKSEKKIFSKIFELLEIQDYDNLINEAGILKYCILLGSRSYEIEDIYNILDKTNKGFIEKIEFKLFLSSLLEFTIQENQFLLSEKNNSSGEHSSFENNKQEYINDFINDFVDQIDFKYNNDCIKKNKFVEIFRENNVLIEGIISLIKKTEDCVFSQVFKYNFTVEYEENIDEYIDEVKIINEQNCKSPPSKVTNIYNAKESPIKKNFSKKNTNDTGYFKDSKDHESPSDEKGESILKLNHFKPQQKTENSITNENKKIRNKIKYSSSDPDKSNQKKEKISTKKKKKYSLQNNKIPLNLIPENPNLDYNNIKHSKESQHTMKHQSTMSVTEKRNRNGTLNNQVSFNPKNNNIEKFNHSRENKSQSNSSQENNMSDYSPIRKTGSFEKYINNPKMLNNILNLKNNFDSNSEYEMSENDKSDLYKDSKFHKKNLSIGLEAEFNAILKIKYITCKLDLFFYLFLDLYDVSTEDFIIYLMNWEIENNFTSKKFFLIKKF